MIFEGDDTSARKGMHEYTGDEPEGWQDVDGTVAPDSDTSVDIDDNADHRTPNDHEEVAPVMSEPTLEPGATEYYDADYEEWREGPHPEYGGDPRGLAAAYVPSGGIAVARRSEENADDPILNAGSEGCRVITLWNDRTGEAGVIHVGAEEMYTFRGEELIDETIDHIPSLGDPDVEPHVLGDVEIIEPEVRDDAKAWNERLANHLRRRGMSPRIVSGGRGKDVYLDTIYGGLDVSDVDGNILYSTLGLPETEFPTRPDNEV